MNCRDSILLLTELLQRGFCGTCASAALETGLAKCTIYMRFREFEIEGLAQIVGTERTRGGSVDIWTAGPCITASQSIQQAGIVAKALASRHPLHHWAAGSSAR